MKERILIISIDTIPEASGGWTSNVDLLAPIYNLDFLLGRALNDDWIEVEKGIRYRKLDRNNAPAQIKYHWDTNNYKFVLCLGDRESVMCKMMNVPYITRYHTFPYYWNTNKGIVYDVKKTAIATIENHRYLPSDLVDEVIPHCVDPTRFEKIDYEKKEGVVWLGTLNHVERPFLFIHICKFLKSKGYVFGSGVLDEELKLYRALDIDNSWTWTGKLTYKNVGKVLPRYKVGVSTLRKGKNLSQVKILEYVCARLIPVVPKWMDIEINGLWVLQYKDVINLVKKINKGVTGDFHNEVEDNYNKLIESPFNAKNTRQKFLQFLDTLTL